MSSLPHNADSTPLITTLFLISFQSRKSWVVAMEGAGGATAPGSAGRRGPGNELRRIGVGGDLYGMFIVQGGPD